jgi:quercetin dioxygenase-like cupin family protein
MKVLKSLSHFIDLRKAPKIRQMEGLETTILSGLHGEKMMMVLSATLPNHSVPVHSHPHEQIGMVYSGKAILRIGDEERIAKKGDFYCIPANVPHSDVCIGDKPFVMLDVFYPLREDFVQKLSNHNST